MDLSITTIHLPGAPYLYQSLLSLFTVARFSGTVHLFVGSEESGYLDCLAASPRLVIHPMEADEWAAIADWSLHRRHSYIYWKVLNHFAQRGEAICIGEDDVLYDPRFEAKLAQSIAELEARTDDYALAYYQATDLAADLAHDPDVWHGRLVSGYPGPNFYGLQGMCYSPAALGTVRDVIHERGVIRAEAPTDIVIHDLTNLYLVHKSLIQHLGHQSTGLGWFHSSPTFGQPWPGDEGSETGHG